MTDVLPDSKDALQRRSAIRTPVISAKILHSNREIHPYKRDVVLLAWSQDPTGQGRIYTSPPMHEWRSQPMALTKSNVECGDDGDSKISHPGSKAQTYLPGNEIKLESASPSRLHSVAKRKHVLPKILKGKKRRRSYMFADRFQARNDPAKDNGVELRGNSDDSSEDERSSTSEDSEGDQGCNVPIRVDNLEKIKEFIDICFRLMQQTNCKITAKAWILKREPQKQTTHPYNGRRKTESFSKTHEPDNAGESTKPDWWPPTHGWPQRGCRHREPDHLKKSERLLLLNHLLYSTKPYTSWTVADLRKATEEVSHKLKPHAIKYLKDIYDVWGKYQRYEEGEIDGTTVISLNIPELPSIALKNQSRPGADKRMRLRHARRDPHPSMVDEDREGGRNKGIVQKEDDEDTQCKHEGENEGRFEDLRAETDEDEVSKAEETGIEVYLSEEVAIGGETAMRDKSNEISGIVLKPGSAGVENIDNLHGGKSNKPASSLPFSARGYAVAGAAAGLSGKGTGTDSSIVNTSSAMRLATLPSNYQPAPLGVDFPTYNPSTPMILPLTEEELQRPGEGEFYMFGQYDQQNAAFIQSPGPSSRSSALRRDLASSEPSQNYIQAQHQLALANEAAGNTINFHPWVNYKY